MQSGAATSDSSREERPEENINIIQWGALWQEIMSVIFDLFDDIHVPFNRSFHRKSGERRAEN